ncbi:acetyltransferase domain-containing protein [Xylaria sp. FL1777]|nr:acetyltransferase domain-containing protein [Xylaria sp. FL1777]
MRVNENLAVSTSKILLVPYDSHHVKRYHQWMQNDDLREATASDLLTLDEEYENQQSWRTAHDKLTFIVCQPATSSSSSFSSSSAASLSSNAEAAPVPTIYACVDDAEERMVGDVNLFLTPDDDDDDGDDGKKSESERLVKGEIDIMIAAPEHRRKGSGEAAVRAFLQFLARHHKAILDEYSRSTVTLSRDGQVAAGNGDMGVTSTATTAENYRLKRLVAKINADNKGSIRLFENLGFRRDGEPNYFNEVSMVLLDFLPTAAESGSLESGCLEYRECFYDRSRLKE